MGTPRRKDEVGNVYGYLTVISFDRVAGTAAKWNCKCACGRETSAVGANLRNGTTRSCGKCSMTQAFPHEDSALKRAFRTLRSGASIRGLNFDIDFDYFKTKVLLDCHYCGRPPFKERYSYSRRRKSSGQDFYSVFHGLDRVDSKYGYSPDNLVTCCFDCNRMKSDFTLEFFIEHIERIFKHGEKTSHNSPN